MGSSTDGPNGRGRTPFRHAHPRALRGPAGSSSNGPSGRGRMIIASASIAMAGIINSVAMIIIFIVITIDMTPGPDRMKR